MSRTGVEIDTTELKRILLERKREMDDQIRSVLEEVGERTIEHLTSFTGEKSDRGFPVHPTGWADRTGTLAERYGYEVAKEPTGWSLTIFNNALHAEKVEALDGMFVVRGIADPGGPVQRAFKKAAAELAPEWEIS